MDTLKKKKTLETKHPGNLGHYGNSKYKNKMNRGRRRNPSQRHRKYSQQNHRNYPDLKKEMTVKVQEAHRTPNRLD